MGMGIGINDAVPDEGILRRKQEPVACSVWFTSTGRIMPKLMKYRETNGEIVTVYQISVLSSSKKNYCGIPTIEFLCEAIIGSRLQKFRLYYYIERQEWKMAKW
ncbi:MAG TPA: hypothetical protein DIW17_16435 [Clostridiales bacterium]|jgi:hypothetical protein|nr:hypothetical protein [Lachnospiraceae bacterium]HCS75448.1 hypothetical protein [Clostridiales bacterium]